MGGPIETDRSLWLMSTHTMGVVTGSIYVFPYLVSRYFLERRASNRNIFVNFILRSGIPKAISDEHISMDLFAFDKLAGSPELVSSLIKLLIVSTNYTVLLPMASFTCSRSFSD
jgi:hypothetical protein